MNSQALPEEPKPTGKLTVDFVYEGDSMPTDIFRKAVAVARGAEQEITATLMGIPVPVQPDTNTRLVKLTYDSLIEMAKLYNEIDRLKKIEEAYNLLTKPQQ